MELVSLSGVSLLRGGEPVLADVDLVVRRGMRVAVTGAAGSGRSTLLALLAGALEPDAGAIRLAPGVTRNLLGHEPAGAGLVAAATASNPGPRPATQGTPAPSAWEVAAGSLSHVRELEAELRRRELRLDTEEDLHRYGELAEEFERAGGYDAESRLRRFLDGFGVPEAVLSAPFKVASGGERHRVRLAGLLASGADVLLLDDAEASLDAGGRELLAERLRRHQGAVVFSSHDRAFISGVATHVAKLGAGRLELRRGGWPRSSPAPRSRATDGSPRRQLLATESLVVRAEGRPLFTSGELHVHAGERIVLRGPNGAGKSTLLSLLAHDAYHGSGDSGIDWAERVRVRHVDQTERGLAAGEPLLPQLTRLTSPERARQLLGLLRVPAQHWRLTAGELPAGERARAAAALVLATEADLLLLDEPTTGLDIVAIELLEQALLAMSGAVILVTHDDALATRFATRVWEIRDGRLLDFRGGAEGHAAGRLRREDGVAAASDVPTAAPAVAPANSPADDTAPAGADPLNALENELVRLEEQLDDPLSLAPRQEERLRSRRRRLLDELSEMYDARLPAPLPRFRVREAGITVEADIAAGGQQLVFPTLPAASLEVRAVGSIAHVSVQPRHGAVLLPWAKRGLVNAAVRLAFYALPVRVVQYWDPDAPRGLLLEPAGNEWHALARPAFEQLELWTGSGQQGS